MSLGGFLRAHLPFLSDVQVLQQCMQESVPNELQQMAVHSLLTLLQISKQAEVQADVQAEVWLVACLTIIAPCAAKSIQAWLQNSSSSQLHALQLLVRHCKLRYSGSAQVLR